MNALPGAPDRVHEHSIEDKGTYSWHDPCVLSRRLYVNGSFRAVQCDSEGAVLALCIVLDLSRVR